MAQTPSNKKKEEELSAEQEVGAFVSKSEKYIEDNRKTLGIILLALLVVVGGFLAYRYFYAQPREKKASENIYRAQHYFEADSFSLALNGDGAKTMGFLEVIDRYASTKAGNLARAYAGISLYKLGNYDEAIKHLKKFKAKDDMVSPAVVGLIGDCYVDMDKTNEAVDYFEKAADKADNSVLSPIYLKKAGLCYEALGQNDKALKCYEKIRDKYYDSQDAALIEKYIKRLELKK